jgi:hypothetical protein
MHIMQKYLYLNICDSFVTFLSIIKFGNREKKSRIAGSVNTEQYLRVGKVSERQEAKNGEDIGRKSKRKTFIEITRSASKGKGHLLQGKTRLM